MEQNKPETAKEIIYSLPDRLLKDIIDDDESAIFHFDISGKNGGQFTVSVKDGECKVSDGFEGEPECKVKASDSVYADVELGRTNPQMAFMMGRIKISNLSAMLKFISYFKRLH